MADKIVSELLISRAVHMVHHQRNIMSCIDRHSAAQGAGDVEDIVHGCKAVGSKLEMYSLGQIYLRDAVQLSRFESQVSDYFDI